MQGFSALVETIPSLLWALEIDSHFFFPFIFINWRLITLEYCSGFCHTWHESAWIYMCSPSQSPLPSPSPSHPSGSSQCTRPEHLPHASNLGWWSLSPLIVYLFQCCSLRTSHPHLLQQSPNYSAIKKNSFQSVLMRWMKLEPIIQSEVSQKDKDRYSILTHIYGILKDGNNNPICKTEKETQMYRTDFCTHTFLCVVCSLLSDKFF